MVPGMGPRLAALLLLLAGLATPAASAEGDAPAWSGVIAVAETISGRDAEGGDRRELERYARAVEERLRQARAELGKAPPFVARVIREDIGFYQAELERVVAARGGALDVGRTTYFVKGNRLLVVTDGARLVVDRATGEARGVIDGHPRTLKLQPVPAPEAMADATVAEIVLGAERFAVQRVVRRVRGRSYTIAVAAGLPNPYALGLVESSQHDDLVHALAELPGLPMAVTETTGEATRRLAVTSIERRELGDAVFSF